MREYSHQTALDLSRLCKSSYLETLMGGHGDYGGVEFFDYNAGEYLNWLAN